MELLPAIDLRGGTAVRLTQGDFDREAALRRPGRAGGALHRRRRALDPRRRPRRGADGRARTSAPCWARSSTWPRTPRVNVEAGGGIRTEDDAAALLESGVARVVLGTAALEEPALAAPLRPPLARAHRRRASTTGSARTAWPRPRRRDGSPARAAP